MYVDFEIKKSGIDVEKVMESIKINVIPEFLKIFDRVAQKAFKNAVDEFYKDYKPKVYKRQYQLYEIYHSRIVGTSHIIEFSQLDRPSWSSTTISDGLNKMYKKRIPIYDNSKGKYVKGNLIGYVTNYPSFRVEGYPEDVTERSFVKGYHGGRGWGVGSRYSWNNATYWNITDRDGDLVPVKRMTPPPIEVMNDKLKNYYSSGKMQDDFNRVYNSRLGNLS